MESQEIRQRRARGSLTDVEILDAAAYVASHSADPITIRAVAARLGSSPMALYRYFPTKDVLVDALVDRVLAGVPVPADGPWDARLRDLALAHGAQLLANPWAIPALFASPSPGVGAVQLGERFLAILHEGGLTGVDAVSSFSAILALNYGRTAFVASAPAEELPPIPAEYFPFSAANAEALGAYASQENYERALDLLLAGIIDVAGRARATT